MRFALVVSLTLSAAFFVGVASCGAAQCTPALCPQGCCTADGRCASGGENSACGSAGNACVNCASSTQICGDKVCVPAVTGGGTGGGAATGGGTGGGAGDAGTFTCETTAVDCGDQAIQQLDLKASVALGLVTTSADGTGRKSVVDATGGGFNPTESYVYARFTDTQLEKLPISDLTALDSTDWDIAFRRYIIRINSGDSGPSCVAAQALPLGTAYDSVTSVPAAYLPEGDDFLSRAPTCAFIDDGSGLTSSPRSALSPFYKYERSCVEMTGRVFVLRARSGRHLKLAVTTYYATEVAQTSCNANGTSNMVPGGTVRLRWQYLD